MRKIILILFLILLSSSAVAGDMVLARMSPAVCGGGASAAACSDVTKDSKTGNDTSSNAIGYSTTYYGVGWSFTAGSSYTATKVSVRLAKVGSPTFNVKAYLCTDSGGSPTTPATCTASTDQIDSSTLTTDTTNCADYTFTFSGYSITVSTKYWVAVIPDALGSTSNYAVMRGTFTGSDDKAAMNNSSTWSSIDSSADGYFHTVACE